jgi:orotidine-5'-phosphate decarboxylase
MEAVAPAPTIRGFGDRLAERVAERASQLVLGLDPDPAALWPRAVELAGVRGAGALPPEAAAARAVAQHCALVLEAVADHCVAVKLQIACFERLGAAGWAALHDVVASAREHGLLVIGDAKRGDIDVSAASYADAFLAGTSTPWGMVPGVGADALTVNPLLGTDSITPFVTAARAAGAGVFVLVRTSNPGAAEIQELELRGGGTVSDRLAAIVTDVGRAGVGSAGLSDVGAVVGATAPDRLERLRAIMPSAVLLIPGVGAQGGAIEDLRPAFASRPGGAIVTVSRGIVRAFERGGGDPAAAARGEAARLRDRLRSIAE